MNDLRIPSEFLELIMASWTSQTEWSGEFGGRVYRAERKKVMGDAVQIAEDGTFAEGDPVEHDFIEFYEG